jgi:hypothetical protein
MTFILFSVAQCSICFAADRHINDVVVMCSVARSLFPQILGSALRGQLGCSLFRG